MSVTIPGATIRTARWLLLVVLGSIALLGAPAPASAAPGDISTVAGTGTDGFSGDGGAATAAQLNAPSGVAPTADGGFLIADRSNHRIRKVLNGTITTVAGSGSPGFSGDGGAATAAQLNGPDSVAPTADGGFLIADANNNRIRKVLNGTITTVAGTGTAGLSGDGGPATAAQLSNPFGVAPTPDGGFLIADFSNSRIRKVLNGVITTVAGSGTFGFSGDGGPATAAKLRFPTAVAPTPDGGFLIADQFNSRIRKVEGVPTPTPTPIPTPTPTPTPDNTPPQTKLKKVKINSKSRKANFSFTSTEASSTFTCKLDKQKKFSKCRSPKTYKHLKPGKHTFKVRATDKAGNTDKTPAKRVFQIKR